MKQLVKKLMEKTPYKIVRRRRKEEHKQEEYDAIAHNSVESMNKIFADDKILAGYFSAGRERLHRATLKLVREARPARGQGVIGDFGCGPGDYFAVMAPEYPGYQFFGYDHSESALKAARARFASAHYQIHDLYTAAPRQHDITICSQTLEHLVEPELALQKLLEVTKPGGIVVLTVPDGRIDTYRGHINFWSPESWAHWLKKHVQQTLHIHKIDRGTSGGANLAAVIEIAER